MFIDTHSHIYGEEFDEDRDAVVQRAVDAGAEHILLPNIDANSVGPMLALCDDYPDLCRPMMGLHPTELPDDPNPLLDQMERMLEASQATSADCTAGNERNPDATSPAAPAAAPAATRFIAVGEVGVDLYWDASRREEQMEVFRRQAEWSVRFGLPLVIHSRSAHKELMEVLTPMKGQLPGGIFHCFGGTADEARELLTFPGFVLGIGGVVTFKKSQLPNILKECVPLERIVLETDAPYLAPTPHRGKRNETAYVPLIIEKLAEVYDTTPQHVAEVTTRTARSLFKI